MTAPANTLLDVRGLRIGFAGQPVVHGIDFHIRPGEKLALVGESGSGKTISALSLLRLVPEAQITGQAYFKGRDLLALSERELRGVRGDDVACIFQEPMTALNPLYTIGDQIIEILTLKKGLTTRDAIQRVEELLAATGIPEPARRAQAFPHQLSGGQRQRAMIAMALASEPQLLIADEPTTALDASLRGQILDLLGELQQRMGMAVLMITHDLHLVRQFADRVAVMERGHLVEQGSVADVFTKPQHAYTRKLLGSRPERQLAPPTGLQPEPVIQANQLVVAYATPLPGLVGWFRVAVSKRSKGLTSSSLQGPPSGWWASRVLVSPRWRWRHWACSRTKGGCRSWGRPGRKASPTPQQPASCVNRCRWCSRTRFLPCRRG